jgi:hypothetical protein
VELPLPHSLFPHPCPLPPTSRSWSFFVSALGRGCGPGSRPERLLFLEKRREEGRRWLWGSESRLGGAGEGRAGG